MATGPLTLRSAAWPTRRTGSSSRRTATSATAICSEAPPRHLLLVATGNITNNELLSLFETNRSAIEAALGEVRFVELGPDRLIVHDDR